MDNGIEQNTEDQREYKNMFQPAAKYFMKISKSFLKVMCNFNKAQYKFLFHLMNSLLTLNTNRTVAAWGHTLESLEHIM